MVKVCECCGHPIPVYDTLEGLTPMQQKIFKIVEKAGQAGISRQQLFDKIYGSDMDGGPLNINVVNVQNTKMKNALAKHGLRIRGTGGPFSVWILEKIDV